MEAAEDGRRKTGTSSSGDLQTEAGGRIRKFNRMGHWLWSGAPFLRPRWWTSLWCAALLIWLVCGLPVMLLGVGALLLHRVLRLVLFKRLGWPRPAWKAWTHPFPMLILAAFAFLSIIASTKATLCAPPSMAWLGVLAAMLFLSALASLRVAALIIALLWIATLLNSFRHQDAECGQSMIQAAQSTVKVTSEKIQQRADDLMSYDSDADIINSNTGESRGTHRVSLARALQDPVKYFTCPSDAGSAQATPTEIFLGESALFEFKSDRLDADADAHLRKLAELIRHNPDASIVLTGYTDKLGVPLLNLKLSEQRAKSVGDWLVEHKVLPYDRIEVRGAGDRNPVVDDPTLFRMNRRVEMRIDCDKPAGESRDVSVSAAGGPAQHMVRHAEDAP
jgi:outer membrane protein OmpA-like peptidoglycan-associated protein